MWKNVLVILMLLHGLIHLAGAFKAFGWAELPQLKKKIPFYVGVIWMLVAVLFVITAVLYQLQQPFWFLSGLVACLLSQILIIQSWSDAKAGTIPNIVIILFLVAQYGFVQFNNQYKNDVRSCMTASTINNAEIVTEADVALLPAIVRKYLQYSGVMHEPKVHSMKVVFEGQMREKGKDWFPFRSEQYNFFDKPARLFYMEAQMYGMTVPGYHHYEKAKATMDIRLFGWYPLIFNAGPVMDTTETVTYFNDMCLLAPATLIDRRITWKEIDEFSTEATFTNEGIQVSATLFFNKEGQLVNFISEDRTSMSDQKKIPFSTPVHQYTIINGRNTMAKGDAVWMYPDEKFVYGQFNTKNVIFNILP